MPTNCIFVIAILLCGTPETCTINICANLEFFGVLAKRILYKIRQWDVASVPRVDHFIANSHHVARRIRRNYGREAVVIYPPVGPIYLLGIEKKEVY